MSEGTSGRKHSKTVVVSILFSVIAQIYADISVCVRVWCVCQSVKSDLLSVCIHRKDYIHPRVITG